MSFCLSLISSDNLSLSFLDNELKSVALSVLKSMRSLSFELALITILIGSSSSLNPIFKKKISFKIYFFFNPTSCWHIYN